MPSSGSRLCHALTASAVLLLVVGTARATTTNVFPGPGTPFQGAIEAAAPHDTLLVHPGNYFEALVVDKPLKIIVLPRSVVNVEPPLGTDVALDIQSDDVSVLAKRPASFDLGNFSLAVMQQPAAIVRVHGHENIKLEGLGNGSSTFYVPQVGLDLDNVTHVSVRSGIMAGMAGCRLANLAPRASVKFKQTVCVGLSEIIFPGGSTGMVMQGVAPGVGRNGAGVLISLSALQMDDVGPASLRLIDTDGVVIDRCSVFALESASALGIDVDGTSDHNTFRRSTIQGATDAGMDNCWKLDANDSTTFGLPSTCP